MIFILMVLKTKFNRKSDVWAAGCLLYEVYIIIYFAVIILLFILLLLS